MTITKKSNTVGFDEITAEVQELLAKEGIDKSRIQIKREIQLAFKVIANYLKSDKEVELREFGTFYSRMWDGEFPVTGQYVGKRRIAEFKTSKTFKRQLNASLVLETNNSSD